jgi:hypothetical protein
VEELRMKTEYTIEYWDIPTKQYKFLWAGQNLDIALRIKTKPYYNRDWMGRRRLIKTTVEVITTWENKKKAKPNVTQSKAHSQV